MGDFRKHEEDAELIKFTISQINKYKFNNNFIDVIEQSKMINNFVNIDELDEYIGITDKNDIGNIGLIFIKITAYLYTINKIRLTKLYTNFINDNDDIVKENSFIFSILDDLEFNGIDDETLNNISNKLGKNISNKLRKNISNKLRSKTFLIVFYRILDILDKNDIYNNEWTNTLFNINDILCY